MKDVNSILEELSKDEVNMLEKGKKHWDMDVLRDMRGGYMPSCTVKNLINTVIENVWVHAKAYYENKHKQCQTMKKLYFKTTGEDPDVCCVDPCQYKDRPSDDTMIGSGLCQDCKACYGWDSEENWVKCMNYSMDERGVDVRIT